MDYKKISIICDEKKMSISELAEKIDFSRQGLNKAISTGSLKIETVELIAEKLGVSIMEFIDDKKWNLLNTELLKWEARHADLLAVSNKFSIDIDLLENEKRLLTKQVENLEEDLQRKNNLLLSYELMMKRYEKALYPESDNSKNL